MAQPDVPTARRDAGGLAAGPLSTFLITDIEGSTRLWEEHAAEMGEALARHDRILREAIGEAGGSIIKTTGDGVLAIFDSTPAGIAAALTAQRRLAADGWGVLGTLRVRMAIHAGTAEARDGDYFGPALNRVARILAIGHGGQVICSAVAAVLSGDRLPPGVELRDLGSHRLRDLDRPEQVFQVVVPDLPSDFPPLRSVSVGRSNLPVQLTSFIGRDRELTEIGHLLERHRLVTLLGVGGTGKTRLMLEGAGRAAGRYPDGVWLAELASLSDSSQIPSEVARALGAPEISGVPTIATVTAFLADKELLLLLDNAEHLVDGVAEIAGRLLGGAPGLRILTTSREALAVSGEAVIHLQSLSCPAVARPGHDDPIAFDEVAGSEAVRLFADRAAAVDPEFSVSPANVGAVTEICRRLDGIPLAIELAAARVSVMSPVDIAARLGDRFRLLAGGRRAAVPRQQTLQALIDWSWDLLTEDDRRLLRRLSVFVGGWTASLAARVVGDAGEPVDEVELLDRLGRLVDRSLVQVDRGATTRYRMLETIRQYARDKLVAASEATTYADRHFAVFAGLAAEAEVPLRGPGMVDWLDRLDTELDNLGAALEWGLEADPWAAVVMANALLAYWAVRVMSEDNDARIEAAVEIARARLAQRPDPDPAERLIGARFLGEAARLWAMSGRADQAYPWAIDAMALAEASGDVGARLYAIGGLALSTTFSGRAQAEGVDTRSAFELTATWIDQSDDFPIAALAAAFAGATLMGFDPEGASALLARGLEGARRSGSPHVLAAVSIAQGRALGHAGRTDEAVAMFDTAVAGFMELGDERFILAARSDKGHILRRNGRLDEALAVYRETVGGWLHLGHLGAVAHQLESFAFMAVENGELERAARLLGAASMMRQSASARMTLEEAVEFEAYVTRVRDALPAAAYASATALGQSLSPRAAVALAIDG